MVAFSFLIFHSVRNNGGLYFVLDAGQRAEQNPAGERAALKSGRFAAPGSVPALRNQGPFDPFAEAILYLRALRLPHHGAFHRLAQSGTKQVLKLFRLPVTSSSNRKTIRM